MNNNELLPCPFCGAAGKHVPSDYVKDNLQPWPVVECTNQQCGAWVPVESWNNRTPSPFTSVDMSSAAADGFRDGRYPATAWRVIDRKGKRFTVYSEGLAEAIAELGLTVTPMCDVPPSGWECSRDKGHEGPCAASEVQS